MIEEILKSRIGIILLSIIWGLGLSAIFKKSCDGKECRVVQYKGPSLARMKGLWTHHDPNKCYKYIHEISKCSN